MNKGIRGLKTIALLAAIAMSASLVACNNASFTANKKGNRGVGGLTGNPNGVPFSTSDDGNISCHVEVSKLSDCFAPLNVKGVNVWIVVDTSSSFTLREQVGRQLAKNFENGLRNNLPLTISVIAANSSQSPYSSFGYETFYRHNREPLVIQVNQGSDYFQASQDLETKFSKYMKADPRASWSDGGPDNNKHTGANELGLLNILNAMTKINVGDVTRRSDYGWLVIFASDENDPCVPDPTVNAPAGEQDMYDNECFFGGQRINPTMVYNSMRNFAGSRKMMVSGVLNQNGKAVLGDPGNSGVGYGYLQVIEQAQGVVAPLSF